MTQKPFNLKRHLLVGYNVHISASTLFTFQFIGVLSYDFPTVVIANRMNAVTMVSLVKYQRDTVSVVCECRPTAAKL
jgi:hypothetical protein